MPPRPRDPSKKTIYLDQSTLSDAYRASLDPPTTKDARFKPLRPWVERVAQEANLSLGAPHLFELARTPPEHKAQADGMAAWIDSMPTVWVRSPNDVGLEEQDYWVKIAAGLVPSSPVEAFGAGIRATIQGGAGLLIRDPTKVGEFLDGARKIDTASRGDRLKDMVEAVRKDALVASGWSEERKEQVLAENRRRSLREIARVTVERLNAGKDADLGGTPLSQNVGDDFVELVGRDAKAMPTWRVINALMAYRAERYRNLPDDSPQLENAVGDFADFWHVLTACGYCDVFTCDRRTKTALGDVRAGLGKSKPLAPGKNPTFVADLMATWP